MRPGAVLLALLVALAAGAAHAEPASPASPASAPASAPASVPASAPSDPFPCPPSLREGVDFWKKVWGTWTLSQVALHDMEHPSIVYEVARNEAEPLARQLEHMIATLA